MTIYKYTFNDKAILRVVDGFNAKELNAMIAIHGFLIDEVVVKIDIEDKI